MATSSGLCSLGKKYQTENSETPYHQPIKTMTGRTSRVFLENQPPIIIPIPSMYGIFTYILRYFAVKKQPNIGKYTGHMDS